MREIKGRFGTCYIQDFFEADLQEVDLTMTDPPYNVGAEAYDQSKAKLDVKDSYNDLMSPEDYIDFSYNWYNKIMEKSKMLVFSPGHTNIGMWHSFTEPTDYLFHNKPDGQGFSRSCMTTKTEMYLVYGHIGRNRFNSNTIVANIDHHVRYGNHPHPKPPALYKQIIQQIKPKSVLDPFLGSGTTAVVCEELGIPWVAYEKNPIFADDIEARIIGASNLYRDDSSYLEV